MLKKSGITTQPSRYRNLGHPLPLSVVIPAKTNRAGQKCQPRHCPQSGNGTAPGERALRRGVALGNAECVQPKRSNAVKSGLSLRNGQPHAAAATISTQPGDPRASQKSALFPAPWAITLRQDANHRNGQWREKPLVITPIPQASPKHDVAPCFVRKRGLPPRRQPETAHRRCQPQGDDRIQHRIGADALRDQKQRQKIRPENRVRLSRQRRHAIQITTAAHKPAGREDRPGAHGEVGVPEQQPLPGCC